MIGMLQSLKQRSGLPASEIIRAATDEARRGDWYGKGNSEYGRRVDITLAEVLEMNPGQLVRARDTRRQRGRFGESSAVKDQAVEAYISQVMTSIGRRPVNPRPGFALRRGGDQPGAGHGD